ncbi:hypothetical protein FOMA001_g17618 [Fusarium oxysporum f. sp. matthiolae]|nr:hypothetical protein FOMA001_g17618 [Fusarium oxysporum f. sp. matthiolae]
MDTGVLTQFDRVVYQATREIFVDEKAKTRKVKGVKRYIRGASRDRSSVLQLMTQYGAGTVHQSILRLLSDEVYESNLIASQRFPDLFEHSVAQSEARTLVEEQATKTEQPALEDILQTHGDDSQGNSEWTEATTVLNAIRHTAVHRLRTNSAGLERFLADAENLAGVLGDNTFTQAISQLRLDTQATLTELIRNKQFIQLQLEKAQEEIARQRAELNQKEQEILVRMASEDRKYRDMAGERLERALGLMGDLRVASIGQGAVLESIDDIEDDPLSDDDSDFDHAEQFEDCSEA